MRGELRFSVLGRKAVVNQPSNTPAQSHVFQCPLQFVVFERRLFYLSIGGSLGVVNVAFSVQNGTAILGEDFSESGGTVQFSSGQTTSFINITILDDDVPEKRDYFTVSLDSVTGGAKLASPKTVTVTIETSDDPGGLFGFVNSSQLTVVNPSLSADLSFVIQREGGAEGEVEVSGIGESLVTLLFAFLVITCNFTEIMHLA